MKNICDYMIIQRDKDGFGRASFTGNYPNDDFYGFVTRVVNEENGIVVVPWMECKVEGHEWSVDLVIPEGGLYRVETKINHEAFNPYLNKYEWEPFVGCARHIGVGDIFVMAGQSNMSGYGREPAYDPPELGVHAYMNSGEWELASQPLCNSVNSIYPNNDGAPGNSPGLSFGRMMKKYLGVPIGLVTACQGGSSLESWNPAEENPFLYKAMEDKIEKVGKVAGMIWMQGCNETNPEECDTYLEKFTESVSLWRNKFGNIPIMTVQINRHASRTEDNDICWGKIRDAQRKAALTIPNVYIVPSNDLPTTDGIHNSSNSCITLGQRMAYGILSGVYKKCDISAPVVLSAEKNGEDTILVKIDNGHNLRTMDDNPCGLNIEDEKGIMNCLSVSLCSDGLIVKGERNIEGKSYFHAYWKKESPAFFIRDIYGMPLLSCYGIEIEDK